MKKLVKIIKTINGIIDLGEVLPISKIILKSFKKSSSIEYSLDNKRYFKTKTKIESKEVDLNNLVFRYLKIDFDTEIEFYLGEGYVGYFNKEWTDLFINKAYWNGGDGLFTFNLNGDDSLNQKDPYTICFFGDTFVNTTSKDELRLDPIGMPNNSYALIEGNIPNKDKISFHINEDYKGRIKAYFNPNNELMYSGTQVYNLINGGDHNNSKYYLSSYNPKENIELIFIFNKRTFIKNIEIFNLFIPNKNNIPYENRGIKNLSIYIDNDSNSKIDIKLEKANKDDNGQNFFNLNLNKEIKEIKLIIPNIPGIGNYEGITPKDYYYGLNRINFRGRYNEILTDIKCDSNSELLKTDKHSRFWLQDGIIIDDSFYSLPLVISSDHTKPDGFQFEVEGVALLKTKIINKEIDFKNIIQKETQLMRKINNQDSLFGSGILDNSKEDGYIYIYGYRNSLDPSIKGRELIVSRTTKSDFENIDEWTYFNGKEFVKNYNEIAPILDHVSCEMSVSKDQDNYIAIFTYDVQSPYVAYSLAKTPYGPFYEIRIAYANKEKICSMQYDYNAKCHPHLSKEGDLLVSFNVNTSSLEENFTFGNTYGPRFINLKKIGG